MPLIATQIHRVAKGETLTQIATRYGIPYPDLLALNRHITNPNLILIGAPINVPAPDAGPFDDADPPARKDFKSAAPWYDIILGELGVREIPGKQHNPRIIEYHRATSLKATDDETAWCSALMCWGMEEAGIRSTRSAAARSWLTWGIALKQPRHGCVVVLRRGTKSWQGHVTLFAGDSGKERFKGLGGNQGNAVSIAPYRHLDVLGYRWPEGWPL